jgi:hypothetical protein
MRRRFGQESGFGSVSSRERQNADQFFADLFGRRVRPLARAREDEAIEQWSAPVPEAADETWGPPLHETDETSAPAMHEADEAADEQWGEDDPKPTVAKGKNEDEIIVTRADGSRYVVRRKVRARVVLDPGRFRTGLCWTDERVFGRATWCQGTQGTIDVGANLPAAAKQLLDTLVAQINRGDRPEDIARTLENAPVQAFVEISIAKDKNWAFTGDFRLELSPSGIISKSAEVAFDKGWFKVGVEFQDDGTGKSVQAKLEIPLGKRTVRAKKCEEKQLVIWREFECFREERHTGQLKPIKITKDEWLYLYFEYSKDLLRRDPKAKSEDVDVFDQILRSNPKLGTALLNKRTLQRLDYLIGQGYWIETVKGYTSPEGRRGPPPPGSGSKWEGNDELARERAVKAHRRLVDRYGGKWLTNPMPPRMRFPAGRTMPDPVGVTEKPELKTPTGAEREGADLDHYILWGDPKEEDPRSFLEKNPNELNRMTDEDAKLVRDVRLTDRARAARLFENLRRVEIHVVHEEELGGRVRYTTLVHEEDCPADVHEAAQNHWGLQLPLFKADPPICG